MRKLWIPLLLMLAVVLTVFLAGPNVMDSISRRRFSHLLQEYKTSPTRQLCEKLAKSLDTQKVEKGLGNEILKELMTPLLKTRSAYSIDKPVNFSVTRRFPLRFSHMKVLREYGVETEDGHELYSGSGSGGNSFNCQPRFFRHHPPPDKPGDYKGQVRYRYELIPDGPSAINGIPTRQKKPDEVVYQCEFVIPVQLKIVPNEHAESVNPLTSPNLDTKMKAAFTTQLNNQTSSYGTPSGRRKSTLATQIVYKNCPADAAFQMSFRFKNGEVKTSPASIRIRQGTSGQIDIDFPGLAIEQTGTHPGTLVLSPDFQCAYIDPDIKSIWAGNLEFPMSVTIHNNQ